ncbi:glucuronate isomerase [Treponema parvum]|uniref:glucuronate isomerase n=1 Tax=Treponema parvum TaxID=138851 RepID=UPI001AEC68CB|nr:glucuronate isomerase [Treponema parvum]QTQ16073.1 glucuronate isomerase [Treponema parvum]
MKDFFSETFMLESPLAVELYEKHAKSMPIFDYHCHLSAKEIYEDKVFSSLGGLWFDHDHYKWRLIRAFGTDEKNVTGNGDIYDKYLAFVDTLPYAVGNPVLHWTYCELKDVFGITEPLTRESAKRIWDKANADISQKRLSPRKMLAFYNVKGLCTTEDASADLSYHKKLKDEWPECKVIPAWRPDKILGVNSYKFLPELKALSLICGPITSYSDLKKSLVKRMNDFSEHGCVASDHDLNAFKFSLVNDKEMDEIFKKAVASKNVTEEEATSWKCTLLVFLYSEYHKRNWAVELHAGCNRDQNMKMVKEVGEACGYDSAGDNEMALPLGKLFNFLEENGILSKSILFSLNPKDLWTLASLCYTFHEEGIRGKMQLGAAWWMQDHKKGMIEHMDALANTGLLGTFIGMLTDSRSFLSYSRHDYFRRILCTYLASYVEKGEYPYAGNIKKLTEDICYNNVIKYLFG